ncbi:MAG: dTDP-4-dehydrorhamnose 3,5-epimerase [Candidatus Gracilibacteria bacterium]|nr:dTDP-4-dehydrorhamnose 3,5-epimerase [Candidatus Gracilibacteria bacterium]
MFKFTSTKIADVIVVEPQVFGDDRGFFMETYSKKEFENAGIDVEFVQDNHSKSKKGVFRGFHFQTQNTQSKLVRVVSGSVLDFAIDLRKDSVTYGEYIVEELSASNKKQLFVPQGFAHGFLTLEDNTEFVYKCDDYYSPEFDGGIIYSDPRLNIDFEAIKKKYDISELSFSEKDKNHPSIDEFFSNNPF